MKYLLVKKDSTRDVSELIISATWSGGMSQVSRKLDISIATSSYDIYFPQIQFELGDAIQMVDDEGKEVFWGFIFSQNKDKGGKSIVAYDPLIYIAKSTISLNTKNMSLHGAVKAIGEQIGISTGQLADAGGYTPKDIFIKKKAYEAIMALYTEVSKVTGKKYMPKINGRNLEVIEKGSTIAKTDLTSDTNITSVSYSESIEEMISRVLIYDKNGNKTGEVSDNDLISKYGVIQEIEEVDEGKGKPEGLIKGVEMDASVEAIGYFDCISGNAVKIRDIETGQTGLFYIDSDTHTFQNGQHTMSLKLNFKNIMDEKELGNDAG